MKVFFTGTERIQSFNRETLDRIYKVTQLNAEILIGNYRGFDELALTFLFFLKYRKVTIYDAGGKITFGYPVVDVGRYPAQDIAMSKAADYMLAVYDGKSRGVAANLQRMPQNRIRIIRI